MVEIVAGERGRKLGSEAQSYGQFPGAKLPFSRSWVFSVNDVDSSSSSVIGGSVRKRGRAVMLASAPADGVRD